MKRTNVFLKSTQIRELKSITRETGATVAGLIRKAIDDFIGRRKADQKREKAQRQHTPETR
jgi:glycine cleavage system aminomethyltransferase T